MSYTPYARQLRSHDDALAEEMERAIYDVTAIEERRLRQLNKAMNFGHSYGMRTSDVLRRYPDVAVTADLLKQMRDNYPELLPRWRKPTK